MRLPDLSLPGCKITGTPIDLTVLLYQGAACIDHRHARKMAFDGYFGQPCRDRLPLVKKIHDVLDGNLAAGVSGHTVFVQYKSFRLLTAWADQEQHSLTISSVVNAYIKWTDSLLHRHTVLAELSHKTIYGLASSVSKLLTDALGLPYPPLGRTRISRQKRTSGLSQIFNVTDKEDLSSTFEFGRMLMDICEQLTPAAIFGKIPLEIKFRNGKRFKHWSGNLSKSKISEIEKKQRSSNKRSVAHIQKARNDDNSLKSRFPLVNLRIQCELLIFISQTSSNLEQAYNRDREKFIYEGHHGGYQVRPLYKDRKKGEVAFQIFSEYRTIFDRYLAFLDEVFVAPPAHKLFPFYSLSSKTAQIAPTFSAIRKICKAIDVPYTGPRILRRTRINFFLRKSGSAKLTAEMAQHTERTLFSSYIRPHHQVAAVEISKFHAKYDPALASPSPGACANPAPEQTENAPPYAPAPDCVNPAGCLFCVNHRDIDSLDHVWSLASYRYLKSLELSLYRPQENIALPHPAQLTITNITDKLKRISEINENGAAWVDETSMRMREEYYHPKWDGFIQLIEIRNGKI